jgi:hypothetical protein
LLKDELPERLIETRTAVIKTASAHMTPRSVDFVRENYLSVGHVSVLGKMLPPSDNGIISFEIQVPGRYLISTKSGIVAGVLDDDATDGPRSLSAGLHTLRLAAPSPEVAVVWARAVERGFSPFRGASPERVDGDL